MKVKFLSIFILAISCLFCNEHQPQTAQQPSAPEVVSTPTKTYREGIAKCDSILEAGFISMPTCVIGTQLPAFEAKTMAGKPINEQYFKGKLSIINFWFIGCTPCVVEIPGLDKLAATYGEEKINYLAIAPDSEKWVKPFLEKHPWRFDHLIDSRKLIEETFLAQWGYPLTMVVDPNGIIIEAFVGGKTDASAAQEIFERLSAIVKENQQ